MTQIKPENWLQSVDTLRAADWILFPEHWQIGVLSHVLKKPIFPSLSSYHLGYSKVEMTQAFQVICPENVPHTKIIPKMDGAVEEILDDFFFPFVVKTIRSARGYGVTLVENRKEFLQYVAHNDMLYVQEWLPVDRDLRVVIVGQEVVTAYWRIAPQGGFHNNLAQGGRISFADIPATAIALVQRLATDLAINHAGFDLIIFEGHPYLLEFNMRFGNEALRRQNITLGSRILTYLEQESARPSSTRPLPAK